MMVVVLLICMAIGFFTSAGFVFSTLLFIVLTALGFYLLFGLPLWLGAPVRRTVCVRPGAARALIHKRARRAPIDLHGSLDIEDERRQPIARILLADVARQIS